MHDVNATDYTSHAAVLDGDLRPADIAELLERLKFRDSPRGLCAIKIDSPVRDYLVAALRRRI